jgi:hypothetical protein
MTEQKIYDKADSWSVAVMLFQLATGRLPFGMPRTDQEVEYYMNHARAAKFSFTE